MKVVSVRLSNGDEFVGELEDNTESVLVLKNPCSIVWTMSSSGKEIMNLFRYNVYSKDGLVIIYKSSVYTYYVVFDHMVNYYIKFLELSELNLSTLKDQLDSSTRYITTMIEERLKEDAEVPEALDNQEQEVPYYSWLLDNIDPPSNSIN